MATWEGAPCHPVLRGAWDRSSRPLDYPVLLVLPPPCPLRLPRLAEPLPILVVKGCRVAQVGAVERWVRGPCFSDVITQPRGGKRAGGFPPPHGVSGGPAWPHSGTGPQGRECPSRVLRGVQLLAPGCPCDRSWVGEVALPHDRWAREPPPEGQAHPELVPAAGRGLQVEAEGESAGG